MDPSTLHAAAREAYRAGQPAAAEGLLRQVLAQDPTHAGAATDLGMAVMAQGRWLEGALLYEARLTGRTPPLQYPRWRGEPIDGKRVLVWPEQGLGDQIMCARYAAALQARGCDVTLVCTPALHRLFAQSLPAKVLPAHGTIEFDDPDVWLWTMSLIGAVGDPLGQQVPYLRGEAARMGRIGVATRGSPTNRNDARRSLPDDLAAELLSLPGAVSLLPEHSGARDFHDTAQIVAGLDLVVSVDTSVAHLAGAMGKPVWILIPARDTDWRWGVGRTDSPWYPSARLFRQGADEDWRSVLEQVKAELARDRL